jgi:hypothetical protein
MNYGKMGIVCEMRNYGREQNCGKGRHCGSSNELWETQSVVSKGIVGATKDDGRL